MDNWHQRILLTGLLLAATPALADNAEQVIVPDIDRRVIAVDAIDSEDIEISFHAGVISIEDFETTEVIAARAAWHISEDFFIEASYSFATGDQTSYEELTGGLPLFTDEERDFNQYNLAIGWNALPGQVLISDKYSFNSSFYLLAGVGSTDFLGNNWFTVTIGGGYRLLLTDAWALHIDVRDHIFDRDTFGLDETTNNIELTAGISFFF